MNRNEKIFSKPFIKSTIITFSLLVINLTVSAEIESPFWKRIGPDGGDIRDISVSPSHPDTVYATTKHHISKTNNGGISWVAYPNDKPVNFLVDSRNPQSLFYYSGGLFKSTDNAITWYSIATDLNINNLSFLPLNTPITQPLRILTFIEDSYKQGIAVSNDGGEHWLLKNETINEIREPPWILNTDETLPSKESERITIEAKDPNNTNILYGSFSVNINPRASYRRPTLIKSIDDGTNWIDITPPGLRFANKLLVAPSNSNNLYGKFVKSYGTEEQELITMFSNNGGGNWETLGIPSEDSVKYYINQFYISPQDTKTVYATLTTKHGNELERIAKSIDSGKNWQIINTTPYLPKKIVVNPHDNQKLLIASRIGIIRSENGGQDWVPSSKGIPFTGGELFVAENDDNVMYLVNSYNLSPESSIYYRTTDGGMHWESFTQKAPINGTCFDFFINPTVNQEIICQTFDSLYRSKDRGENWQLLRTPSKQAMYANDGITIYSVSDTGISRSLDNGDTWKDISNLSGSLSADPQKSNILYNIAESDNSVNLYKSKDSGENWDIIKNSTSNSKKKLLIHPLNPERLLFIDGYNSFSLTDDGGKSWRNILEPFELEGELVETKPEGYMTIRIRDFVFNPTVLDGLYVATEKGFFETFDLGKTWNKVSPAFSSEFNSLQVHSNNVFVSTDTSVFKLTENVNYLKISECLFNWAEQNYSELFHPAPTTSQQWGGYIYRYYSSTNTYLGFFHEKEVHLKQVNISDDIKVIGFTKFYQDLTGCN